MANVLYFLEYILKNDIMGMAALASAAFQAML